MNHEVLEHNALHFCLVSLNQGKIDLTDTLDIQATAGEHMNYQIKVSDYLTEIFLTFVAKDKPKHQKWQHTETTAFYLGISEEILREFLGITLPGLDLHDFEIKWEDELDEYCRTFRLTSKLR